MQGWTTADRRVDVRQGWDESATTWTSSLVSAGFAADQAVLSWNLPADVEARWQVRPGETWLDLAVWDALPADRSARTSLSDGDGTHAIDVDTVTGPMTGLQVRGRFSRPLRPEEVRVWVSFSGPGPDLPEGDLRNRGSASPGHPVGTAALVRPLSQRQLSHRTDLGGGGAAWCAATSLTMVCLAHGVDLPAGDPEPSGDPRVVEVARRVYDRAYDGTGNWAFNAALAGCLGLSARVVRLRDLDDAERITASGLPLICSISFGPGEMPGADYDTRGHLLVMLGLTDAGDVMVADPACSTPQEGLRSYPRGPFDAAWARSRRTAILVESPRGDEGSGGNSPRPGTAHHEQGGRP